jgi:hypothetical protein
MYSIPNFLSNKYRFLKALTIFSFRVVYGHGAEPEGKVFQEPKKRNTRHEN